MIVKTVIQLLLENAAVTAIVGNRIFPRMMPDAVDFPAIVVTKASGIGQYDLQGDVGIEPARVQIDLCDRCSA